MEKNYRYAIRKTSLGVGSVAIGVFLAAGQLQTVQAAEATREIEPNSAVIQPSASETTASTTPSAEELGLDTNAGVPMNEALNTAEPAVNPREGVAKTADGTVRTEKNDSLAADEANVDHYRDSDLANNGVSAGFTTEDVGTTKEGVTATVVNPSPTSSDKKKFGIQIDIDREKSERTYTGVYVTDNKRGASVKGNAGQIVKPGEDPDFAGVNYPKDDIQADNINASVKHGRQVEIGISTGEEFLKDLI